MAAGAGFSIDFIVRVFTKYSSVTGDQCVEELLVEGDIDFLVLRFPRPVRKASRGNDGDALFSFLKRLSEKFSKHKTAFCRRHRIRKGIDDDRHHGDRHIGIEEMKRHHGRVIKEQLVGKSRIEAAVKASVE